MNQSRAQRLSLTRTTLDDMTLRSPSQTLDYPKDLDIPLLGISVDKDNQLWQKMLSDKRSMISGLDSTGTLEQQVGSNDGQLELLISSLTLCSLIQWMEL